MAFRHSFEAISPPWLSEGTAGGVQYSEGMALDALADWAWEATKASMPGYCDESALRYVGRDVKLERGPDETAAHYATRLQDIIATSKTRGNPQRLLRQLASWFYPATDHPIRLVNNAAVWHEYNYGTDAVTKTNVGTNWNWDGKTWRWHRGWVIIDGSIGRWRKWTVGEAGVTLGDGHVLGSTMTLEEADSLRRVVKEWKPANVHVPFIIVTLVASMFDRTDASPPNPDGDWDLYENRNPDAMYISVEFNDTPTTTAALEDTVTVEETVTSTMQAGTVIDETIELNETVSYTKT
jgi:hypothetical protein